VCSSDLGSQLRTGYSPAVTGARQNACPDCDIQVDAERATRQDSVLRGTTDEVDGLVNDGVAYLRDCAKITIDFR
jgi:hypothetical protein